MPLRKEGRKPVAADGVVVVVVTEHRPRRVKVFPVYVCSVVSDS